MATLPPVPQRPLGNTGISVSVLGYGASSLGGVFSVGKPSICRASSCISAHQQDSFDEQEGIRSVHAAFAAGINFFDTSPYYGALRSEQVLGRALKDLPRDRVVLSTKVGRYGPEQQHFDFSAARVTASVHESLQRLQTDYIDIIQCHDIEFGDLDQVVAETLPALVALRQQGIVRHIGITGLPLGIFPYVLERCDIVSLSDVTSSPPQGASGHRRRGPVLLPRLPAGRCPAETAALPAVKGRRRGQRLPAVHGAPLAAGGPFLIKCSSITPVTTTTSHNDTGAAVMAPGIARGQDSSGCSSGCRGAARVGHRGAGPA